MFTAALKAFSSNITSNYTLSQQPISTSGPWEIFDAKKRSTGKPVSVFVFDKKSLDPHSGLGRTAGSSLKRVHEEVLERLRKEASSLARLRHPNVLELVEPVEDTRNGGLMFATEQVTASLGGLLHEKDSQERAGGVGGRPSRFVVESSDGGKRRREVEIDELEIQKGLLQIAKGLEFLHESAGLVHGNLTPEAIYINTKSDWKISGLGFSSPPDNSNTASSVAPIALSEVLHHDPRLPRFVQLNVDYTSPDFVFDHNISTSADLFSLGLLIVALYNSPHTSPLQTNSSQSTYNRLLSSPSTTPSPSNQFLSSRPLPKDLMSSVLPRLLTRRPAQRLNAREFQESQYFDNILVSTIRFLDSLPAKTANEKAQFMRGLARVLSQFPKSVMEKKVLPALLEEMKDRELLALILQNVFKIIKAVPSGRRAFTDRVIPKLREVFLSGKPSSATKGVPAERDTSKEAGLMVLLENMNTIAESCSGKEFKDDILPILFVALESPTHSVVDASLRSLPNVLPVLDYATTKNDLFPVVATVFSKTNSLGIKVRGLEAFVVLCGGSSQAVDEGDDGLSGVSGGAGATSKSTSNSNHLDKYVIQEKMVPLMKAIKTKEPAVMMAALNVYRYVGQIADTEFIATEVLPTLWSMSLGPLLNLQQFRAFMDLVKSLSSSVEQTQTKKLQELSSSDSRNAKSDDFMSFGPVGGFANGANGSGDAHEGDFERLVTGRQSSSGASGTNGIADDPWASTTTASRNDKAGVPVFSWSTPPPTSPHSSNIAGSSVTNGGMAQQLPSRAPRTITPDLSSFAALTPSSGASGPSMATLPLQPTSASSSSIWSSGSPIIPQSSNPWGSQPNTTHNPSSGMSFGQTASTPSPFSIAPPPSSAPQTPFASTPTPYQHQSQPPALAGSASYSGFSIAPPPTKSGGGAPGGYDAGKKQQTGIPAATQKSGLDKYQSLL
ncbi:MAG: hypothetical protein M1825_003517 [Sarcosagium campestre]|nr:MAG: hypothetical protein M1825_003517 [Sarcosagium campestre]